MGGHYRVRRRFTMQAWLPSLGLPLALTMGDACGIGPEIVAAWFRSDEAGAAFVVGDVGVLRRAAAVDRRDCCRWRRSSAPPTSSALPARCIPVLQADGLAPDLLAAPIGKVDARAGAAAARSIECAVALVRRGEAAAMVTAPIHKEAFAAAGDRLPRPHRDAAGARCRWRRRAAGAHDARQRRAEDRARDDPHGTAPRRSTR